MARRSIQVMPRKMATERQGVRLVHLSVVLVPLCALACYFVIAPRTKEEAAVITAFMAWLQRGGARAPKLRIAPSALGGLGAFATHAIAAGELTISVPRQLMITDAEAPEALLSNRAVTVARGAMPELNSMLPVVIALLSELSKGASSFYAPYLDTLPRDLDNPADFSSELRAELKGSTLEAVLRRHEEVELAASSAISTACAEGPPQPPGRCESAFGHSKVRWAIATVRGRALLKELGDGGGLTLALAPLIDVLNHEAERGASAGSETWDDARSAYEVRSSRGFNAGEEVVWSYGPKPNHALMISYGFALPPGANPYESVVVNMKAARPQSHDPLFEQRESLLDAAAQHFGDARPGSPPRMIFTAGHTLEERVPKPTLVRARILVLREESELRQDVLAGGARRKLLAGEPLPSSRENDALRFLAGLAKRKLELYVGDVAADEALLAADDAGRAPLGRRMRMVVRTRLGEKRVLRDAIEAMDRRVDEIEQTSMLSGLGLK